MSDQTPIRVAQTLGLTTSAMLGGVILSQTLITIPALLQAPSHILQKQWFTLYSRGKRLGPGLALFSAVNLLYISYERYHQRGNPPVTKGGRWEVYTGAAGIIVMIVPFTLAVMKGVNGKLIEAGRGLEVAEVSATEEVFVKRLVDCWATLNLFRGLIPVVGTVVGLWAALG